MDQSAYSYTTVSDSHYFSTEVHGTSTTGMSFFKKNTNQLLLTGKDEKHFKRNLVLNIFDAF